MSARTIGPALLAVGDGTAHQGCLRIENGRILSLEDGPQYLDYELPFGSTVTPGLIDLHVNGTGDRSFAREPAETVKMMSTLGPAHGLSAFLPSIMSGPWEPTLLAAAELYKCLSWQPAGARALGVHFEGPFLNPEFRRAHEREYIMSPTPALIEALLATWTTGCCRVTMAPELEDAPRAAAELRRRGVVLSAGHTGASYAVGNSAIEQGYNILTHTFNAMPGIHHRTSSILVAYVLDPTAFCEAIADGAHVSLEMLALLYRLKGVNLVLTSDAMPVDVRSTEEAGLVRNAEGMIAGSRLMLDQAVRNLMAATGITLAEAVVCATWAPARAMGIDGEMGILREGMRADFTVWDRHNRISHTFVDGVLVYTNN